MAHTTRKIPGYFKSSEFFDDFIKKWKRGLISKEVATGFRNGHIDKMTTWWGRKSKSGYKRIVVKSRRRFDNDLKFHGE